MNRKQDQQISLSSLIFFIVILLWLNIKLVHYTLLSDSDLHYSGTHCEKDNLTGPLEIKQSL